MAVDRSVPVRTSRSTVGTMTDVLDYLKGLWFHRAELQCPGCGEPVARDTPETISSELFANWSGKRVVVTYPEAVGSTEHYLTLRDGWVRSGYRRLHLDGKTLDVDEVPPSKVVSEGQAELVLDRAVVRSEDRARLIEVLETALKRPAATAFVWSADGSRKRYSARLRCESCQREFAPATPGLFSFNSPVGACPTCKGFGRTIELDLDKVIPDRSKTLAGGAIRPFTGASHAWERRELRKGASRADVPMDLPVEQFSERQLKWLIDGDKRKTGWWGIRGWFDWLESRTYKMHVRVLLSRYRKYTRCPTCNGGRLKPEATWWKIAGTSLPEFLSLPVSEALALLDRLPADGHSAVASKALLDQCKSRLSVLQAVGLGYLSLDRASRTLSGGETQRVSLTAALGASLTDAMFVLDEPTIGLHPRDRGRLAEVLRTLTSRGNTAVVVEHDEEILRSSDRVVELGPGAGAQGGTVVFDGAPAQLAEEETATGRALRDAFGLQPRKPRALGGDYIELDGATGHNLKGATLRIPLGRFTCVTGVSGSGKSSLVSKTLYPAVARRLGKEDVEEGLAFASLCGVDRLSDVLRVDQSPLGRTSRGNAATYLKIWDRVRALLAQQEAALESDLSAGAFSFNVPGGRCETCRGEGSETVEMQFLADVTFSCPDCKGRRFGEQVLGVRYRGLHAAELLELTVAEALVHFEGERAVVSKLKLLEEVGLGYLRLGQALSTLSGGEAQRLKLTGALLKAKPGALVILDEPTAGLHQSDMSGLIGSIQSLVDRGDTVVVVEHNMAVAAQADFVIEVGPAAGPEGGEVCGYGTPGEMAQTDGERAPSAPFISRALARTAHGPGLQHAKAGSIAPLERRESITIVGAREHNLKNLEADIPRNKLVVVTGPSGSGKSSLAFDVLFAEAQRRYLETLSPYARQYLPQLPRPDVDRVDGVPPSVSLQQSKTQGGATSTVATLTEISHYLRLLWARLGIPYCRKCDVSIEAQSVDAMMRRIESNFSAKRSLKVFAPLVRGRRGGHRALIQKALAQGFVEAQIDGETLKLTPDLSLSRHKEHDIDVSVGTAKRSAIRKLLEQALEVGNGFARIVGDSELQLSSTRACPSCGDSVPELDPRFFSFNTRQGACVTCEGTGVLLRKVGRGKNAREERSTCQVCEGTRLSELARSVRFFGAHIDEVFSKTVKEAALWVRSLKLKGRAAEIGDVPLSELVRRLDLLGDLGLGYLGLDRTASTLSGGELQRVRLSAQLGSGLTGVLYVLDEPTIGLHPRDTGRLIDALRSLLRQGNSVVVVEHDADMIRCADHILDIGPTGGRDGGYLVAKGPPKSIEADPSSVTGPWLGAVHPVGPPMPIDADHPCIELFGASQHNLKEVDLRVPIGRLVVVAGVSGSGKSTLIRTVLLRALRQELGLVNEEPPGSYRSILHADLVRRAVEIDQSPIGRTPRSVPATYLGIWDVIRKLYAATPDARARGYGPS
ncbi:MAG: excinuclease ABC subunit UvrA, partial [Myxococcota bacterium]